MIRLVLLNLVFLVIGVSQVDTTTIIGNINDTNKDVIVGARVIVQNEKTGIVRETSSDGTGNYMLTNLPASTYTIKVYTFFKH